MFKKKVAFVLSIYLLTLGTAEGTKKRAYDAFPNLPMFNNFRDFLRDYHCRIRTSNGGWGTPIHTPGGALARWDLIQIRCKRLDEDFFAAKCRNPNCNLERFGLKIPEGLRVRSSPVFKFKHLAGMPERVKVLIPVACFCQAIV